MNLFLLIFFYFLLETKFSAAQNCTRFCGVNLSTENYIFKNDLLGLNPQYCSHLILNAELKEERKVDYDLLKKAFLYLKKSQNILPNLKILTSVNYHGLNLNATENGNNTKFLKLYEKLDGFYFDWRDDHYPKPCEAQEFKSNQIKECFSKILIDFRKQFNNKIIVTTIGPKNVYKDFYNLAVLNENVDFIAVEPSNSLNYVHQQNYYWYKQWFDGNNGTLANISNALINNGISKSKLLIYINGGPVNGEEPRIRVIWSSINNFPGLFIDNIQDFHKDCGFYTDCKEPTKVTDDISKLEILHTCPSSSDTHKSIKNLTCYFSLESETDFHKLSKEIYEKCDRIIFNKISTYFNNNISTEKLKNIIEYFYGWKLPNTTLILSIDVNYNKAREIWKGLDTFEQFSNIIALNIKSVIERYNLNGIELICDESTENLQKIITNIRKTVSKEIEIGLQINVFKASKLVDVINNLTFVTHKINPLSDVALTVFYQWNVLCEEFDLDLKKVIIKISPAIWKQKVIHTHPGKHDTSEKENPEDNVILNRKYLCSNKTIKQNLPKNTYLNSPIIISIKGHEKIQEKILENVGDQNLLLAGLSLREPQEPISEELYYLRFETKEIIEYKIKIVERFEFGGIAFDSITDDDFEEICGYSLFKDLIKIVK